MIKTILLAVLGLLILIVIVASFMKWRNKRRELNKKAEDRLREEALDRALMGGKKGRGTQSVPFDVKYDLDQRKQPKKRVSGRGGKKPLMLQLVEHSELSTRKYMFHIDKCLKIGNRANKNDLVITCPGSAECQCEIFRLENSLYIKKLSEFGTVMLQRKKKYIQVEERAILLKTRDVIRIGTYAYEILFLNQ